MKSKYGHKLAKTLLFSLLSGMVATNAAASEINTPVIITNGTTYTSASDVNVTSMGAATSVLSAEGLNSKIDLSGNVNINLQNLSGSNNIINSLNRGAINLTGSQLNIQAQSSGSLIGINVQGSGNDSSFRATATTNITLSGSGTVSGLTSNATPNTEIGLGATNIHISSNDANSVLNGLNSSNAVINGNLVVDIQGGSVVTGVYGRTKINGLNNNITINTGSGSRVNAVYSDRFITSSGANTTISITDTANSYADNGLVIRTIGATDTALDIGTNSQLNINVKSKASGLDPSTGFTSGANGMLLYGFKGQEFNVAAGNVINITMEGQAINSAGQSGTAGLTAAYTLNINSPLNIDIKSPGGAGIRLSEMQIDAGILSIGLVHLDGDTVVKTNNGYAIASATYGNINGPAAYPSQLYINTNGGKLVQLTGNLDHKTLRESAFNINLDRADSFLLGSSMGSNKLNFPTLPFFNECRTDITLANGAVWHMTGKDDINTLGDSIVNNLTFANKGFLDMSYSDTSTTNSYEQLTAHGWLGDQGKILMNTALKASFDAKDVAVASDRVIIEKFTNERNDVLSPLSQGTHTIDVKDASLLSKIAAEGYLLLVEDKTQGAAQFVGGELRKGGIFKYKPIITNTAPVGYSNVPTAAINWYLTGFEKIGIEDEAKLNVGLAESRYVAYNNEQDTLIKRLGELRQHDKEQGLWVRIRGANNSVDGYGINRNSYVSTYLGYDWRLKDQGTTKRYLGLAINHTNNNFDYEFAATGKGQSNVLTVYNTRLGDKGHYLDLVGKIGRMSNDYKYQEQKISAQNWFYSLSAEYGRSIVRDKGWYYEPQIQFTLGHINSASYKSKEASVNASGINSAILRAGLLFGRKYNQDKPEKNGSYYGKVFYNHEFGGSVQTTMQDTYGDQLNISRSYGGSWVTVGLGTSLNLNKKSNLYLDVEKAFGGKIRGGWAWQGGWRWRF